jgi:ribosome-binding factor A
VKCCIDLGHANIYFDTEFKMKQEQKINNINKLTKRSFTMKNLILVAVLLLIVSSLSFGQSSASVTATVNAVLTIVNTNDLAIGNVVKGTTKTITSNAADAAAFTITGEPNTQIVVTVAFPLNLSDGTNNLPFTGEIPIHNTIADQSSATAFGALTGGTTPTNATGNLYVYVGGGVTAAVAQPSGNYSGTINVNVVYP